MFFWFFFYSDEEFVKRTLGRGDVEALRVFVEVMNSLVDRSSGGKRPTCWEDCVHWARCKWETLFNNDIRQILHCFPPNEVKHFFKVPKSNTTHTFTYNSPTFCSGHTDFSWSTRGFLVKYCFWPKCQALPYIVIHLHTKTAFTPQNMSWFGSLFSAVVLIVSVVSYLQVLLMALNHRLSEELW